jgi:hypothetical protein
VNALLSPEPSTNGVSFLRDAKRVGDFSEVMLIAALSRAGYIVSLPLGESHRYDLIVDRDGVLSRVQVKTGRLRKGAVVFSCHSSHGEVEYFGVYCEELGACYLVPIADTAAMGCALRVSSATNGQRRRIRWASAYLL